MYPTVKDILALSELRECRLLHPGVSCKQMVKTVTVMDNPNILHWLAGYEVLFSNGYSLANFQNREWKQFFSGLVKQNVAALFIKLAYFVDRLPEEIVDYTAELDFPVVVVPNSYSWTTLSDPIQQYVIEQQYYYMKNAISLRDTLNSILIQGGSLSDICAAAAEDLGKTVAVFDSYWRRIGGTNHPQWETVSHILHDRVPSYGETLPGSDLTEYPHYLLEYPGGKVFFVQMPDQLERRYLALLIEDNSPMLQAADTYRIEQINMVIMLFFYKEIELGRIEKHYYTNFLLDLVDGVLTDTKEIKKKAARLERQVHDCYHIIVFEREKNAPRSLPDDLLKLFGKESAPIRDIMICERNQHIIIFHPATPEKSRASIEYVCSISSKQEGLASARYGISRSYDIASVHAAYSEALFALSAHRFINRQAIYYEDLGLLRLFETNSRRADVAYLSEFYGKTIQPLAEYDTANETQLVDTLESFFKHELSVVATANALYLHENSLRARIKRIEKVTGRSLKASMDVAELIIGIQIHRLM